MDEEAADLAARGGKDTVLDKNERKKLEKAGWRVGTAAEFLGLSAAEEAFIELKLGLARALQDRRAAQEITQTEAANLLGSSQSRFAKMEAADSTVSLDLLVRALLALGASHAYLANAISRSFAVGESSAHYKARKPTPPAKKKTRRS